MRAVFVISKLHCKCMSTMHYIWKRISNGWVLKKISFTVAYHLCRFTVWGGNLSLVWMLICPYRSESEIIHHDWKRCSATTECTCRTSFLWSWVCCLRLSLSPSIRQVDPYDNYVVQSNLPELIIVSFIWLRVMPQTPAPMIRGPQAVVYMCIECDAA